MLVLLPVLAVVFVFMVLRTWYREWEGSSPAVVPDVSGGAIQKPAGGGAEMETGSGTGHEISTNVNLIRKDREGRPEMQFLAERIVHTEKNTSDITRPRIRFFSRSGEVITLSADYGHAVTKGAVTDISNIESGRLWGNVILIHHGKNYEDPADDILVGLEDLTFNNETYELATDGPVVMVGREMDLTARRMQMVLDRKTRRIDTMTFYENILITLEAGDRLQMGLGVRPKAAPAAESPTAPAPPASPPPAPAASPGKASPEAATAPKGAPPPEQAPAPEVKKGGDLWRIDLGGNVDARQMDQRLLCDQLTLYNATARSAVQRGGPEAAAPPVPEAVPPGTTVPAPPPPRGPAAPSGPAATPVEPGAGPGSAIPTGGFAEATPGAPGSAEEPEFLRPGALPPLVVIADGPLIITPVPAEEREELKGAENEVTAVGKPAVVEDGQTRIVGDEVRYNLKTGGGLVVGREGQYILEQPGRLWLTGGRLQFDRTRGTADVAGKGKLHALVATESLTGTPAPAAGAKPPTSALDASWVRGMRLAFYELPSGESGGGGQLRQAAFSGQAEVVQQDGLLKGDELVIDFFPALPGGGPSKAGENRGQAVQRLVGHGDVFVKNTKPSAAIAGAQNVGDITCQNLDMTFARGATGGSEPKRMKASGKVLINDAKGKVRAEDLLVTFARNDKGELEAEYLDATGDVLIDRADLLAEGDHVKRDLANGILLLEGTEKKPARAARTTLRAEEVLVPELPAGRREATIIDWRAAVGGAVKRGDALASVYTGVGPVVIQSPTDGVLKSVLRQVGDAVAPGDVAAVLDVPLTSRIVGPKVEFLEKEGKARVRGAGELEVPASTDLRGRPRQSADPLVIQWKESMYFEDARNFAFFDGDVKAATGASRLDCRRMWVYFRDAPEKAPAPGAVAGAPAAAKDRSTPMGGLMGRKAVERIFAENDVRAVERRMDPDGAVRYQMEIGGDNLTYVEANRKAYLRGPGRMRILSREKADPGRAPPPGLGPADEAKFWADEAPAGYARTNVAWTEGMAYDGATDRCYFKGNVETVHVGRGSPGAGAASGGKPTTTKIRSGDLQVVFSERAPSAAAETSREDRMTVAKMVADGGVQLWVDDRRGSSQRLMYQRAPELMRLYSGADQWASLWQATEATQRFGEVAARVITYYPDSKRIEMIDQQELVVTPKR
jgi:pyruvate/2-oxoglutarate dehydrogenase complex dihydrolipoamide acyltransferase (E2) component/lipopolysaccharide export system protein LptA